MRPSLATKLAASSLAWSTIFSSGDVILEEAEEPTPEVAAPADEPAVDAPPKAGPATRQARSTHAGANRFMPAMITPDRSPDAGCL
jgi:hypothetical protein